MKLAAIQIGRKDVKLVRPRSSTPLRRPRARRGPIKGFSKAARQRLRDTLRNIEPLTWMVTLTYGDPYPQAAAPVKAQRKKMVRWFNTQGVRGVWVLEFQERDAPHFVFLLNGPVNEDGLREKWRSTSGNPVARGVWLQAITHWEGLITYVTKTRQKKIPDRFMGIGPFWHTFGGIGAEYRTFVGPVEEVSRVCRAGRNHEKAQRRQKGLKPRKDNGRYNRTIYGAADAVRPLAEAADGLTELR